MLIPLYQDGRWTTCDNPTADSPDGAMDELMSAVGYRQAIRIDSDNTGIGLVVWHQTTEGVTGTAAAGAPKYFLDIYLGGEPAETVGAAGIVEVMDLLGRWSPAVQAEVAYELAMNAARLP